MIKHNIIVKYRKLRKTFKKFNAYSKEDIKKFLYFNLMHMWRAILYIVMYEIYRLI